MEYKADYSITAKPMTYSGVVFRSRLEARWAAFFDVCGWDWTYEPLLLDGWLPDFLIRTSACDVLAEVKPIDLAQAWKDHEAGKDVSLSDYHKAARYGGDVPIVLLGRTPCLYGDDTVGLIVIDIERTLDIAGCTLEQLSASLRVKGHPGAKWVAAERRIQGLPPRTNVIFPDF